MSKCACGAVSTLKIVLFVPTRNAFTSKGSYSLDIAGGDLSPM